MAGICGMAVVIGGGVIFAKFYALDVREHAAAAIFAAIAGFFLGWVGYLRLARLNRRARKAERVQINSEQDDPDDRQLRSRR